MAESWDCGVTELRKTSVKRGLNDPLFEQDDFTGGSIAGCASVENGDNYSYYCYDEASRPRKRKHTSSVDPEQKRSTKLQQLLLADSNPISVLHECMQCGISVVFQFVDSQGPAHEPSFTFSAIVNEIPYTASGSSKKLSKENAARLAVAALRLQFGLEKGSPNSSGITSAQTSASDVPPSPNDAIHKSVDDPNLLPEDGELLVAPKTADAFDVVNAFRVPPSPSSTESLRALTDVIHFMPKNGLSKLRNLLNKSFSTTNPCGVVDEIAAHLAVSSNISECPPAYEYPDGVSVPPNYFAFCLRFLDEPFYGTSAQKKTAKHNAGCQALNWLLDIVPIIWRTVQIPRQLHPLFQEEIEPDAVRARDFAAQVSSAVYEKLNSISSKYAGSDSIRCFDHNSMAAICMSQGDSVEALVVATGSSVIYRKNLSGRGKSLKDCQAAVLATRGFKRYLLGQVAAFLDGNASVFLDFIAEGRLRLKADVGFHLFLTQTPSGRCSMDIGIPLVELGSDPSDKTCSSVTVPVSGCDRFQCTTSEIVSCRLTEDGEANVFDDIITGYEKLKIMSTSDKLLKKLVVGIQGSLVSTFAHPIFFQTICMSGNDKLADIAAGLYQRLLPRLSDLDTSSEFPIVCPEICGSVSLASLDENTLKLPTGLKAFVWVSGGTESDVEEFLDTNSGLQVSGRLSCLCKKNLGAFFYTILESFASGALDKKADFEWPDITRLKKSTTNARSYCDMKHLAPWYRTKMTYFWDCSRTMGQWISKCPEEDDFTVTTAGNPVVD